MESKMEQKWNINFDKNKKAFKSLLDPSWASFGSFWGRSGGQKTLKFHWFYYVFVNITFLKKIRLGNASWTQLGPILLPNRLPKGSQIEPKMESKRS